MSHSPGSTELARLVSALVVPQNGAVRGGGSEPVAHLPLVDAVALLDADGDDDVAIARRLTGALLVALAEGSRAADATDVLGADDAAADDAAAAAAEEEEGEEEEDWSAVAAFYRRVLAALPDAFARRVADEPDLAAAVDELLAALDGPGMNVGADGELNALGERCWAALFPEAVGILDARDEREQQLRVRRTVAISEAAADPIVDPAREILFTANALITTPLDPSVPNADLEIDDRIAQAARDADDEPQRYWYDHPVPIGISPESNEIAYGLTKLNQAIDFEMRRGNVPDGARLPVVLSVSVTHDGLHDIARVYVADVVARAGGVPHLDVHVFSERETDQLVDEVLAPAARQLLDRDDTDLLDVVGVDGRYGRHYSFLKAIAAVWHVAIDDQVRGTFKIDLDQVFPQQTLVNETGRSALEHLARAQWGARGTGEFGDVELGMLAGALVNESDIAESLFTPDVGYPDGPGAAPDYAFFSKLPQALSTVAEMGTRYAQAASEDDPDGETVVIERIHVTGGTTGARVDALRRYRPFTPSFIARAEDQAYVLATYDFETTRLAYLHADGLIMRHDKEAFAGDAIAAAALGKLIGDHVRILLFSAYAEALGDVGSFKAIIDPFTGGFVSRTPLTTTMLRFALQAAHMLEGDDPDDGVTFVRDGAEQLQETLDFVSGDPSPLAETVDRERRGWALFYDTLDALEAGLARGDDTARKLAEAARQIVQDAAIS